MGILDLDPTQSQDITPEMAQRRRLLALAMLQKGQDYSPVQSWTQGAARLANALFGGLNMRATDTAEAQARKDAQAADASMLDQVLNGGGFGTKTAATSTSDTATPSVANTGTMTMPSSPVSMPVGFSPTSSPVSGAENAAAPPPMFPDSGGPVNNGKGGSANRTPFDQTVNTFDQAKVEGGGPQLSQPRIDATSLARTLNNPYSKMSPIAQALLLQKLKPETPIALAEGGTLVRPSTGEIVARGAPKTVNPTDFQRNYQAEVEQDKTLGIPPPTMAEYHASTNPAVQKTVETAMNDVQSDQDLIAKFDRALELSKVAYAGHAARARAEAVGWTGSKAAEATQELESLTNAQTIGQLSQIHGGRMSPQFLNLLTTATGAVDQEQGAREAIFTRIKEELKRDMDFKQKLAKSAAAGRGIDTGIATAPPPTVPKTVSDQPPPGVTPDQWRVMSPETRALWATP